MSGLIVFRGKPIHVSDGYVTFKTEDEVDARQWERIAAVVRATLPGVDADVWDARVLKARDALTPEDIEAVQP